ncbi:hypothetical protein [Geminicoccus harenae]|uniref:hypothetical protein n=1 Tax=Geminicoccus harenae TaxID=2498453 RepID=UPI00168AB206|nr:hypothetical protein [Geminicoccus harenae]
MMHRRDLLAGLAALPASQLLTGLLPDGGLAQAAAAPLKKNFVFWECMRWQKGPASLASCGLRRMPIYYEASLITNGETDFKKVDKVIADIKAKKLPMVTLDVELWNPASIPQREKYIRLIEYVRARVPSSTKLSLYGIMPRPRYHDYVAGGARLKQRQHENKIAAPLAAKCDWIMPMFHTYQPNRVHWAKFAKVIIAEARQYKKPVMPWLWPQYHERTSPAALRHTFLPGDFFREQLETAYTLADSLCIWGTRIDLPSGTKIRATWNPKSPWWTQTKTFLRSKNGPVCKL